MSDGKPKPRRKPAQGTRCTRITYVEPRLMGRLRVIGFGAEATPALRDLIHRLPYADPH